MKLNKLYKPGWRIILLVFFILSQQIAYSQVQTRHIIDFSGNDESVFFEEIAENQFEIAISPIVVDEDLCLFISRGANNQQLTFRIKKDSWSFSPSISYDQKTWISISAVTDDGDYFYFSFKSAQDSVMVSLFGSPKTTAILKAAGEISYYTYQRYEEYVNSIANHPLIEHKILGKSVEGRDIRFLTITDPSVPDSIKRSVWLLYRQHCDEYNTSYIMEGMINYLLSDTSDLAKEILSRTIFKIVPVVNVDGVFSQLDRINANGIDLNRNWSATLDHSSEEPEVRAVHDELDDWILNMGGKVSLMLDMHVSLRTYDAVFRSKASMTSAEYVDDQSTFLDGLIIEDKWQQKSNMIYSDGSSGMARLSLYNQHGINIVTSETPPLVRYDASAVTEDNLMIQGITFTKAIYRYLFHINFMNSEGEIVKKYTPDNEVFISLDDFDEKNAFTKEVKITTSTGDNETIVLEEVFLDWGNFRNKTGISIAFATPIPNDGIIQGEAGGELKVFYQDSDYADDSTWAYATFSSSPLSVEKTDQYPFVLNQNYPNPFSSETTISYSVLTKTNITINILDITGKKIKTLVQEEQNAGTYNFVWDTSNDFGEYVAEGVYFYTIRDGEKGYLCRKMIVIR